MQSRRVIGATWNRSAQQALIPYHCARKSQHWLGGAIRQSS